MVLTCTLKLILWRGIFKHTYYTLKDKDKDDSRFLVGNNTNQKTVEQYLKNTERKAINLEFYPQGNCSSKIEVK